jgi:hypothetical protein
MTCKEVQDKKYQERPSPPYHARDCKGKTMKGKNGKSYISKADTRGVYKWVLAEKTKTKKAPRGKAYKIHDNGSVPFVVYDRGGSVDVYTQRFDQEKNEYKEPVLFKTFAYKKIHLGDDPKGFGWLGPGTKGNSILLEQKGGKFVFIGWKIQEFTLTEGDEPVRYSSPIGNSDVPYPYLKGKTHTYFMIEEKYVPNEYLDPAKDPYGQLYGHIEAPKGSLKSIAKRLRMKTIHKRVF